jgi:hypothetical protein
MLFYFLFIDPIVATGNAKYQNFYRLMKMLDEKINEWHYLEGTKHMLEVSEQISFIAIYTCHALTIYTPVGIRTGYDFYTGRSLSYYQHRNPRL